MSMKIWLLRHGQPDWYPDDRGQNDPGLTELGHVQARQAAERLVGEVDEVWVSPAVRAQQTAAPLLEVTGLAGRTLPWLMELRTPDYTGRSEAEVREMLGGARFRDRDAWWQGLPGGGDAKEWVDRIAGGLDAELAQLGLARDEDIWRGERVPRSIAMVCHAGTSGVVTSHLLGVHQVPWAWFRFGLMHAGLCSLTTVAMSDGRVFALRRFNDLEHLAPAQRTY